ncbi:MAG: carboxymuconolactone decarboxylase family protein [Polyangiales bacterium]
MENVEKIREKLPECAKDIKLNLQNVLSQGALSEAQRWGCAVATAIATRQAELIEAVVADAAKVCPPEVLDDAKAAAALMGMNNVFYRFRHFMGTEEYDKAPARLRMQRIVKPAGSKVDFELFCLAVSSVNGCEACVKSHEHVVKEGGLTTEQVVDSVRIAATMLAAANALMIPA